jgi:hypothetical protein
MRHLLVMASIIVVAGCTTSGPLRLGHSEFSDVNGGVHRPLDAHGQMATALIFIASDCPIANSYAPEINSIVAAYSLPANGEPQSRHAISFYLVHVDQRLNADQARRHADAFGFRCPVLMDPKHHLAKAVGATVTPEAAVINRSGEIVYRGQIDDRYIDFGVRRGAPTYRALREAIDALLRGEPVERPRIKAIGCFIPEPS